MNVVDIVIVIVTVVASFCNNSATQQVSSSSVMVVVGRQLTITVFLDVQLADVVHLYGERDQRKRDRPSEKTIRGR